MNELQKTLLPIFLEEVSGKLGEMLHYFKSLKQNPRGDLSALEVACRAAHTVKGSASLVGLTRASALGSTLEAGLAELLKSEAAPQRKIVLPLFAVLKELAAEVKAIKASAKGTLSPLPEEPTGQAPTKVPHMVADLPDGEAETSGPAESAESGPEQDSEEEAAEIPENVCCRFRVGTCEFHLPMEDMAEIATLPPVTPLPLAPGYLKGLINLRGQVLPVVDLGALRGDDESGHAGDRHLVIASTRNERLAFLTHGLPHLAPEYGGELLQIQTFVENHGVKFA